MEGYLLGLYCYSNSYFFMFMFCIKKIIMGKAKCRSADCTLILSTQSKSLIIGIQLKKNKYDGWTKIPLMSIGVLGSIQMSKEVTVPLKSSPVICYRLRRHFLSKSCEQNWPNNQILHMQTSDLHRQNTYTHNAQQNCPILA